MKVIKSKEWKENYQFYHHESYWEHGNYRFKVTIRYDNFYERQSHARCYVWSIALQKWEEISSVPFRDITLKSYNTTTIDELLNLALEILGNPKGD